MTSNYPKERSLGQNCIWVIEIGLILEYLKINSIMNQLELSEKGHFNIFPLPYKVQMSQH